MDRPSLHLGGSALGEGGPALTTRGPRARIDFMFSGVQVAERTARRQPKGGRGAERRARVLFEIAGPPAGEATLALVSARR